MQKPEAEVAIMDNGYRFDLVATDKEGRVVLLGEVKSHPVRDEDVTDHFTAYQNALQELAPFLLLADRSNIRIYRWDGQSGQPVSQFSTQEILSTYDPEFGQRQVF